MFNLPACYNSCLSKAIELLKSTKFSLIQIWLQWKLHVCFCFTFRRRQLWSHFIEQNVCFAEDVSLCCSWSVGVSWSDVLVHASSDPCGCCSHMSDRLCDSSCFLWVLTYGEREMSSKFLAFQNHCRGKVSSERQWQSNLKENLYWYR